MEGQRMDERLRIRMVRDIVTRRQTNKTRTEKVMENLKKERMLQEREREEGNG